MRTIAASAIQPRLFLKQGAFFVLAVLSACQVTPVHEVLPYPEHIAAGIAAGDKVDVVTRDGSHHEIVVSGISESAILAGDTMIDFEQIRAIRKKSWSPPQNPCDDGRPLGCSVHPAVTTLSDLHADNVRVLNAPCTRHDFCYRYGHRTYGLSREQCDADFIADMRNRCNAEHKLDLVERAGCLTIARQMHTAVRAYGDAHFQAGTGKYCEYAGPPAHYLMN